MRMREKGSLMQEEGEGIEGKVRERDFEAVED